MKSPSFERGAFSGESMISPNTGVENRSSSWKEKSVWVCAQRGHCKGLRMLQPF
jgi:hypothetical protein